MRDKLSISMSVALALALLLSACGQTSGPVQPPTQETSNEVQMSSGSDHEDDGHEHESETQNVAQEPTVSYTLQTSIEDGLAFVGVGGEIDGVRNPTLTAQPGDVVSITVVNGDDVQHDMVIDEFGVHSDHLSRKGAETTVVFAVEEPGEFVYYCSIPGHREAGMWGTLQVGEGLDTAASEPTLQADSVVRNPSDLPDPIGERGPQLVTVGLSAEEVTGQLADGTTYNYFTFNGVVPAPMIRVRVGDTVELHLENNTSSTLPHSIDLHAVNGPGGGAVYTETAPGDESMFTFEALTPGLFVYHCATPSVAHHIANGMYGLILVEPEGGLPEVDREFYVMQGEVYTEEEYGTSGHLTFSHAKMLDEDPEYFTFNGAAMALTSEENALRAEVGETVRIYFGVGGPNFISSFHVIGEIFDHVYNLASLTTEPMTDVQTALVPPGGATVVEFGIDEPGRYILVDHALSRLERGLAGYLIAEGEEDPDVFHEGPASQ